MIKKTWWTRFRYWLVSIIFNEDERYLLFKACNARYEELNKLRVTEKWVDKEEVWQDMVDINMIGNIFI